MENTTINCIAESIARYFISTGGAFYGGPFSEELEGEEVEGVEVDNETIVIHLKNNRIVLHIEKTAK